ncbi:MAG: thiamine pyrophosphate-dependent dehydrogenase E1 component subunit alpha [Alphaproteobacteria bacterium]
MLRIRAFEEAAIRAADEKLVLGAIHPSVGQEAVAAGVCAPLRRDDLLLSTHRGHGHTLAKGADARAMMRELFGREGGNCGGKGGSMHIADFSVGMLGANGVVGANINIAAGAAHGVKLRGSDQVVVCIFGDGAMNRGPFLEGLNWAVAFDLPVLFVCEDNGWASTTNTSVVTGGGGPAVRAEALGLLTETVDGNDVIAVEDATRQLVDTIRAGGGPRFLHAKTYRLLGHTSVDKAGYRPAGEAEGKWADDPITRAADLLSGAGVAQSELEADSQTAEQEMTAAYEEAKAAPWPAVSAAYDDVQDIGAIPAPVGL